jgi:hypothetical protein
MTRELAAQGLLDHDMGGSMAHRRRQRPARQHVVAPVHGGANVPTSRRRARPSALARQCIGGLIAHHEAMAAMSAPLINS